MDQQYKDAAFVLVWLLLCGFVLLVSWLLRKIFGEPEAECQYTIVLESRTQRTNVVIQTGKIDGHRVSLVKNGTGRVKNIYVPCDSKESARYQAEKMGLGLEPLLNQAHSSGERDHYHLYDHCCLRYDDNWSPFPKLHNYHFTFGPERKW